MTKYSAAAKSENQFSGTEALFMARDTYKYHFKQGHRIIYTGITNDLQRREEEHRRNFGGDGHIFEVGRATTRDDALKWEREQAAKGRSTRRR
ncbi:MAG: hypothetical protein OXI81_04110 [Paracoccaceae bacterium]|nr:hypothetical protein [Paracoccaceae bacterium]